MSEAPPQVKRNLSPDWFVQGILTKIGDIFDRLTGRRWRPGSSLATSELVERLKALLDAEQKTEANGRRFVPHNIKLKMQWDKFSTDEEKSLKSLEHEMLKAVVDHINDRHLYTYAPISIEVKPDYFTEGVKLFVSFEKFTGENADREIDVSIPGKKTEQIAAIEATVVAEIAEKKIRVRFVLNGEPVERILTLKQGERLSIGRTKENNLSIDDQSISKYHAAIVLNADRKVVVADTGSTNGTFIGGKRIDYGKAVQIRSGEKVKFGTVDVTIDIAKDPPPPEPKQIEPAKTEAYKVGEFEFSKKTEVLVPSAQPELPKTESAIQLPATQAAIDVDLEKER
jgi:pSer/pThr/pTyr-binding forkhead associated (FHA) protein